MTINEICWLAMSYIFSPNAATSYQKKISRSITQRFHICKHVAKEAKKQNVSPYLAVAVAYRETRFSNITSPKGAKGPLGVIPKYHCTTVPCDYIKAGVHALKKFTKLNPDDLCTALAQYNAGFKGTCADERIGADYAESVIDMTYELKLFNQKECYNQPIR